MLVLIANSRLSRSLVEIIPKLILLKLAWYLWTIHGALLGWTGRTLERFFILILLIIDHALVIVVEVERLLFFRLDEGVAYILGLELVETRRICRFEQMLFYGFCIRAFVDVFIMKATSLLFLVIYSTLK